MAFPVTTIPPSSAGGGSSPPFAISDTTGLQDALDDKVDSPLSAADITAAVQDLQTSASPQFAGIQLGHASDTTLGRSGPGVLTVEGVEVTTNTAAQTLTNKTLTAPKLANGGFIADANGNEGLILVTTASAVNEVTLTNAAAGNAPKLSATGGDTNINLQLAGKGTGGVAPQGTGGTGHLLFQTTANGVITSRALLASDIPTLAYKGISCGKTSDQAVSADTATDITFTTEIISETSDLAHSTSTNPAEVTVNTTQNYRIRATIVFAANGTGSYFTEYVSLLVGGTEKHRVPFLAGKPGVTQPHHFSVDIDLPVTAAQVVKLQMYSGVNGGSVLGQTSGVNQTILSITPLGA